MSLASDDVRIAAIADRHQGAVAREELLGLGLTGRQIRYRVEIGRLHVEYPGVYSVGRPAKTALERAAAAVLACGPSAALSHRSALALSGLAKWQSGMQVTVATDRRPKGITVHRAKGLIGRDFRTHQGIRVTSPARTILDCAPGLSDKALARAVNEARRTAGLRPAHLADVAERFPHHPGTRKLKPYIDVKGGPTRSEWEDAFPKWCRRHGLPEPIMNTMVAGYEADALFPDERLVIELDSWEFHQDRESFESDRDRDADRFAAGYGTVRITWGRMTAAEAARLQEILRQRRAA